MKKLIALVLLCGMLIGTVVDPNRPLTSFYEKLTCEEVTELYDEAGGLYQLSGERLDVVKSGAAKLFWIHIRQLTLSLRDPLLIRQGQVCKEA